MEPITQKDDSAPSPTTTPMMPPPPPLNPPPPPTHPSTNAHALITMHFDTSLTPVSMPVARPRLVVCVGVGALGFEEEKG